MLEVLVFANSIFLGVLFLTARSSIGIANLFLSLFLFSLGLEVLPEFVDGFWLETAYLTVPLLWVYVHKMTDYSLSWKSWMVFVPSVLTNLVLVVIEDPNIPGDVEFLLLWVPLYVFNLSLLFLIHRRVKMHNRSLKNQYASVENRMLDWVKGLVFVFVLFHLVWIVEDTQRLFSYETYFTEYGGTFSELLTLFAVFWIGHHGLSQRRSGQVSVPEKEQTAVNDEDKHKFEKVKSRIEENKLYLEPDLTLRTLALQVGTTEKLLSVWINSFTGDNFYYFINKYRIEEFKTQLSSPANEHLSIVGIAENAGFRNKSTFYKAFRELEGITPSEYKKRLKSTERV